MMCYVFVDFPFVLLQYRFISDAIMFGAVETFLAID